MCQQKWDIIMDMSLRFHKHVLRVTYLQEEVSVSSDRQYLSYDVCLEVRGRLSELFCVVLCTTVVHNHKHT